MESSSNSQHDLQGGGWAALIAAYRRRENPMYMVLKRGTRARRLLADLLAMALLIWMLWLTLGASPRHGAEFPLFLTLLGIGYFLFPLAQVLLGMPNAQMKRQIRALLLTTFPRDELALGTWFPVIEWLHSRVLPIFAVTLACSLIHIPGDIESVVTPAMLLVACGYLHFSAHSTGKFCFSHPNKALFLLLFAPLFVFCFSLLHLLLCYVVFVPTYPFQADRFSDEETGLIASFGLSMVLVSGIPLLVLRFLGPNGLVARSWDYINYCTSEDREFEPDRPNSSRAKLTPPPPRSHPFSGHPWP